MEFEGNFIWTYFQRVGWHESNQFSSLCFDSQDILDFPILKSFRLGVVNFPTQQMQNGFRFALNDQRNFSFLFSSLPLPSERVFKPYAPYFLKEDFGGVSPLEDPALKVDEPPEFRRSYMLSGKMNEGGRLEAFYAHHWSKGIMTILSSETYYRRDKSQYNAQLFYEGKKSASELILSSQDQLLGARSVYHITSKDSRFSIGGEIYYTFQEGNPGASLGIRYQSFGFGRGPTLQSGYQGKKTPQTAATLTFNPIFGHSSLAYTTAVWRDVTFSTRYDYNIHSYDSAFAIGLELRKDKQILKCRLDTSKGFSVMVQEGIGRAIVSVGIHTPLVPRSLPTLGIHIDFFGNKKR